MIGRTALCLIVNAEFIREESAQFTALTLEQAVKDRRAIVSWRRRCQKNISCCHLDLRHVRDTGSY